MTDEASFVVTGPMAKAGEVEIRQPSSSARGGAGGRMRGPLLVGAGWLGLLTACLFPPAPAFGVSPSTTQTYEVYINAAAEKIWDAITTSEWTERYGYQGRVEYELKSGGTFRAYATPAMVAMGMPEVAIDGQVVEAVAPHQLVQTYRFLFNEATTSEGFTKITWEIEDTGAGFCRLTLTHELDGAPTMAAMVSSRFSELGSGGWSWILSDMKSVLETGKRLGEE